MTHAYFYMCILLFLTLPNKKSLLSNLFLVCFDFFWWQGWGRWGIYPPKTILAEVTPECKKKDPLNKENYHPVSCLLYVSKNF